MHYSITLGDWSEDGHGRAEQYIIDIPDHISEDVIKASFETSLRGFGFNSIHDLENKISDQQYTALENAGAKWEWGMDEDDGTYLGIEDIFEAIITILRSGLPNEKIEVYTTDAKTLIGGYGSILAGNHHVGYEALMP